MRFGFVGSYGGAAELVQVGLAVEEHGWDGYFSWDGISLTSTSEWSGDPLSQVEAWDPMALLGAVAVQTSRVRLGAIVFAIPRREPWKLAREALTVDHLSGGRLVLPVGIGVSDDAAVSGVRGGLRTVRDRARAMDESLEFLAKAWTGEVFAHDGEYFGISDVQFVPRPVQRPRIPVWPVGVWPAPRSMRRAARWDGVLLQRGAGSDGEGTLRPDEVAAAVTWLRTERERLQGEGFAVSDAFDVVVEGELPADRDEAGTIVRAYEEAGATWFVEAYWRPELATPRFQLDRVRSGPPKAS
ncbi:MAG: LLM class flavin-dependent oxidoreductase [Actinomycetota bacterium]|nr:LLM class flavin-dependent oxidoreductase [Actinomycetota bacterium]